MVIKLHEHRLPPIRFGGPPQKVAGAISFSKIVEVAIAVRRSLRLSCVAFPASFVRGCMNKMLSPLPEHSEYRTGKGLAISRAVEQSAGGANRPMI
jgi:hypothetical protein